MRVTHKSGRFCYARGAVAALILAVFFLFAAQAQNAPQQSTHGIVVANMDTSVKPGDNFYLYANGGWIKRTEIPGDRTRVGVFSNLADVSNERVAGLIQDVVKSGPPAGSGARKIVDLYNSYMDEAGIEAKGLTPLRPHLDAIAAIKDKRELAHALGATLRADVDALNNTNFHTPNLFGLWVAPGFHDSDHYTAYLLQGGLELPDREYFVSRNQQMRATLEKYEVHISAMLKLAGFQDNDARALRVVRLERDIATNHISLADSEDIHKADNTWTQADFAAKAPGLDWPEYFQGAGLSKQSSFIVWQPTAFTAEAALVDSTPLETWKDWLAYHLIEDYARVLPRALANVRFAFFGTILTGAPEERPRSYRAVLMVNDLLGDEVGQLYVKRYFPPESKAQAQAMVTNIVAAFRKRLEALPWMDPSTKKEALVKLGTLYVGIGYPETWQNYSAYEVKRDDVFGNVWRGSLFKYQREIARLGKRVDRKEWCMTPQTVNAVNLPLQIALNFPAAILQPPFFDPQAPAAVNYGAIGAVIGHEVSHTFDSEGAAFDSKGAVRNWWTPADLKQFEERTAKLAAQYDKYTPFLGLSVNGKQTLGENIADVAGIAAAYDGYHASQGEKTAPTQDGFSPDQQFFIAFGQNYASKVREPLLRQLVLTDPHSPAEYRADTVRNIDAWYDALHVQPGEKLYLAPGDRVRIW